MGTCLLDSLLRRNPSVTVWCLIRCKDEAHGWDKLAKQLAAYRLPTDGSLEDVKQRVVVVKGDFTEDNLGMTDERWQEVVESVEAIFHCGAMVNFSATYSMLRKANVLCVKDVLRLATSLPTHVIPVHHVSTLGVFHDNLHDIPTAPLRNGQPDTTRNWCLDNGRRVFFEDDPVLEDDLSSQHHIKLALGYSQSKWTAERVLRIGQERRLPISMYRPGRIGGHSRTGAVNPTDFPNAFVKGCIQMGTIPDIDVPVHLVPVDFCADAVVHIAMKAEGAGYQGGPYNLDNPHVTTMHDIAEAVGSLGYSLSLVPYTEWRKELGKEISDNAAHPLAPLEHMLVDEPPNVCDVPFFDMTNTWSAVSDDESIVCVPSSVEYLEVNLRYLRDVDWRTSMPSVGLGGSLELEAFVKDLGSGEAVAADKELYLIAGPAVLEQYFTDLSYTLSLRGYKLLLLQLPAEATSPDAPSDGASLTSSLPFLSSVTNLAGVLVAALRRRRKDGPFNIIGWSFGALVAIEVAKILNRRTDDNSCVPVLSLIDPLVPISLSASAATQAPYSFALSVILSTVVGMFKDVLPEDFDQLPVDQQQHMLMELVAEATGANIATATTDVAEQQEGATTSAGAENDFLRQQADLVSAVLGAGAQHAAKGPHYDGKTHIIDTPCPSPFPPSSGMAVVAAPSVVALGSMSMTHTLLPGGGHFNCLRDPHVDPLVDALLEKLTAVE